MPSKEIEVVAQAQRRAEAMSNVGPRRDVIQIVPPRGMVRRSDLREAHLGGGFLGDDVPDEAFWKRGTMPSLRRRPTMGVPGSLIVVAYGHSLQKG